MHLQDIQWLLIAFDDAFACRRAFADTYPHPRSWSKSLNFTLHSPSARGPGNAPNGQIRRFGPIPSEPSYRNVLLLVYRIQVLICGIPIKHTVATPTYSTSFSDHFASIFDRHSLA